MAAESDLYAPVKAFLQGLGFTVRGEVGRCDVLAVLDDTMIAVELKLTFGLPVLYQALHRQRSVDLVYVAVAVPEGRTARRNWDSQVPDAIRLCRMIGIGLLSIRNDDVTVHAEPGPYQPRRERKARAKLLSEFMRRTGDHNLGGTSKRPRVTAYREDALACASLLAANAVMKPSAVRDAAGVPKAGLILRANVYGWFEKRGPGLYGITPAGQAALEQFAGVVAAGTTRPARVSTS